MSETKKPVIGEKPFCKIHTKNPIEYVCTARECSHRVLCFECLGEHERLSFNHKALLVKLNDWYKEFQKNLAPLYDPACNYSVVFLMEQITSSLKRQQDELNKSQNDIKDAFQKALNHCLTFLNTLNQEMEEVLWRQKISHDETLEKLKQNLENISYKNCEKEILKLMKSELVVHHQSGKLNEFYSKVYNGAYMNQVFDRYGGFDSMQGELKNLRDQVDIGFRRFDSKKFEETLQNELKQLNSRIRDSFYDGIFQRVELDFSHPKSSKVKVAEGQPAEKTFKIVCASHMQTSASVFCGSLSHDIFITASKDKTFKVWDASHNYRALNEIKATRCEGEADVDEDEDDEVAIKSLCIVDYQQKNTNQLHHFILLGGDHSTPDLEVWDYSLNKFIMLKKKAHEDGISCIQLIKNEYSSSNDTCKYYLATAACDNLIKIWTLTIVLNVDNKFDIDLSLLKSSEAHSDFISCIVSLPSCGVLENSVIISGSHDKSVNFWFWENDSVGNAAFSSNLKDEENKGIDSLINTSNQEDKYHFKIKCAHSNHVKSILLLYDRADYSDLEFFATGGGDTMIKIWSIREKKLVKAFANEKRSAAKMSYLGNGKIATSANENHLREYFVYIWDWRKSELQVVLKDHKYLIQNVSRLLDGTLLTSDNKSIRIWKVEIESKEANEKRGNHLPLS